MNGGAFRRNLGHIPPCRRRGWRRGCRRPKRRAITLGIKVIAPGLMVMAIIYFMALSAAPI